MKLTITNRSKQFRPLYIEPEGADFWMAPEQTVELQAAVTANDACFELWDGGEGVQVFPSQHMGFLSVFCNGQELECGYPPADMMSTGPKSHSNQSRFRRASAPAIAGNRCCFPAAKFRKIAYALGMSGLN